MTVTTRRVCGLAAVCTLLALWAVAFAQRAGATSPAGAAGQASRRATDLPTPPSPQPSSAKPYPGRAGSRDPWVKLQHRFPGPVNINNGPDAMELELDGTVLVHDACTPDWWRLTPDSHGNYVDGTWSRIATMPSEYAPLYFASAILPTGTGVPAGSMIVEGGEYNGPGCTPVWTNKGALYNAATNKWTSIAPPAGWTTIGDAQSDVLTDGRFMVANCCSRGDALFDPATFTWTPTGEAGKVGLNDEGGWSLLQNGNLLTIDAWEKTPTGLSDTQEYSPATGAWTSVGLTPGPLVDSGYELGPQVTEPSGKVFAFGANANSAIFDEATSTWSRGPDLPVLDHKRYGLADGAAAPLPDGRILFGASPELFHPPLHFWTYDGKSFTQVADTADAPNYPSYVVHFLVLPNGQVLMDDFAHMYIWTDTGTPNPAWAPTISSVPTSLAPGASYTLSGTQLSGRSQGAAYGDDFQDNTNYPLVRITNDATGAVTFAPTSGETTLSIAPGVPSSTNFSVPAGTPSGPSSLQVIGNGIASAPVAVNVG